MYRGTTPTITLRLSFDPRSASKIWVTFAQSIEEENIFFTKELSDCTLDETSIRVRLSQEETLSFAGCRRVQVQARMRFPDGVAVATRIFEIPTNRILKDGVI